MLNSYRSSFASLNMKSFLAHKGRMKFPNQDSSSASTETKIDQESGYNAVVSGEGAVKEVVLRLIRKVLAEALGTFLLMFCIGGILANMRFMGVESGLMEYAITAGLTVTVLVFSIGSISGAHVNPAVTIAFAAVGPFPWSHVPLYVVAQVGGSVLATFAGREIYGVKPELMFTKPLQGTAAAFWVELVATFIILFLVASLYDEPQFIGPLSGFVSGVGICLGVLISGPVSGGSMNPARSLGPALVTWRFDHLWLYMLAPTIGAICGVFTYRILRHQGWSCKCDPSIEK